MRLCTGFCNTLLQKYQSNQFEFLINLHVVDNKKDRKRLRENKCRIIYERKECC